MLPAVILTLTACATTPAMWTVTQVSSPKLIVAMITRGTITVMRPMGLVAVN
jgi:hypothetical protein|tara:strand:- start:48844 stop:48999 length:156 start_codon:yes stop_codon:yes gene_type:complete